MVLQGGLKKLSKKNLERLKARITTDGFCAPFFIWDNGGALMILDGTQRRAALLSLRAEGWTVPSLPVVYIHAENEARAREILLSISSQYGEWVEEELAVWLQDIDDDIKKTLRLVETSAEIVQPDFRPAGEDEQGKLNELSSMIVKCPECGKEFDARMNNGQPI